MEPIRSCAAAPSARVPDLQTGRVPAYADGEWPYPAGRDHLVSTRPVAGGILAMVVKRDHSPYPFAGADSYQDSGGRAHRDRKLGVQWLRAARARVAQIQLDFRTRK